MRDSTYTHRLLIAAGALCLQLSATYVLAAEPDREQDDPPERVARLSYLKGRVALQTTNADSWTDASLNHPLTTGDQLRVERNARAELQTGALNLQLDERADFSFLELTDDVAQIRLTNGALYVSVRRLRDDETIEVDTPHAAIAIAKPGEYSIALPDDGGRTLVKTYSGECEVTDNRQAVTIKSREQASFAGSGDGATPFAVEALASRTAFDTWAHERNGRGERSASSRHVSPDIIGYSDLDDYGDWVNEPEYGYVWYPTRIASDWSPYRHGHWTWISPWGWTWIDHSPWGFAPFHYGRWAHVRGRWCWAPGPLHARPVYAPALVAWIGTAPPRSSFSFSIAFGSGIGWFPLAPREVYVPSYHCSRRHLYNVNHANTVVVNNVYINRAYNNRSTYFEHVNRNVRDAITVVRPDAFTGSHPVRDHRIHVDSPDLRNWATHNAIPEIRPQHDSGRRASWNSETTRGDNREVVMRHAPSRPGAFDRHDSRNNNWRTSPQNIPRDTEPVHRRELARPDVGRSETQRPREFQRPEHRERNQSFGEQRQQRVESHPPGPAPQHQAAPREHEDRGRDPFEGGRRGREHSRE